MGGLEDVIRFYEENKNKLADFNEEKRARSLVEGCRPYTAVVPGSSPGGPTNFFEELV